jgi:hypothetical protein
MGFNSGFKGLKVEIIYSVFFLFFCLYIFVSFRFYLSINYLNCFVS